MIAIERARVPFARVIGAVAIAAIAGCSAEPRPSQTAADEAVDLKNGARQFLKCRACHALDADAPAGLGPHLEGIFGRPAGAVEGFAYSETLQETSLIWTARNLDRWLAEPRAFLPGSTMAFVGVRDPKDRADLIAYLREEAGVTELMGEDGDPNGG